jgi:hypothetical protein
MTSPVLMGRDCCALRPAWTADYSDAFDRVTQSDRVFLPVSLRDVMDLRVCALRIAVV